MQQTVTDILASIESVVLGKPTECRLALACLLAKGHLLIEDLPGMGKTTLSQVLAATLGLSYQRTQFTSDLLPADVVGVSIFNQESKAFELHQGPIFNQVVLADEINRASPKTQSALLEAMAEKQVSIDGKTYPLPEPFFVIATQNPLFHAGTYPLPESQLDRFMMRLSLGFPNVKAEKQILLSGSKKEASAEQATLASLKQVDVNALLKMQQAVEAVTVSNGVVEYIIALSHVSRQSFTQGGGNAAVNNKIQCKPLSPRAGKALLAAAKAWAFIENRDYLLPDDVKAVFQVVCQHRLEVNALAEQNQGVSVSQQILRSVDVLNPLGH